MSEESVELSKSKMNFKKPNHIFGNIDALLSPTSLNLSSKIASEKQISSHYVPRSMSFGAEIPEQTEPEDLSMHSPRSSVSLEELEELDEAATLYRRIK
jgi:krueppel-like family protein